MKRILSQRIGALILAMAISMSLVSPCVSYAVEEGCPLQEHQHTSECYKLPNKRKLNCGVIAHSHDPECYDGEGTLVCGYSDKIIHTHDKNCYDEDGNLVCDLPEYEAHTHTKDCYKESRVLVCQEAVLSPTHEHTESCYVNQEKCVCGQEDDETHIHTDECFQMERVLVCTEDEATQSHIHTDTCYAAHCTLVCGKNDLVPHTHTAECRDMNGVLICGLLETIVHQHDKSCFIELDGGVSEELQCGKTEHIHSEACQPKRKEPVEDFPSADEPVNDGIIKAPTVNDEVIPGSFNPYIECVVADAPLNLTIEQISGPESVPSKTITVENSGKSYRIGPAIDSPGDYVFRISCDGFSEYYEVTVNFYASESDGKIYRGNATAIQRPSGEKFGIDSDNYITFDATDNPAPVATVQYSPVVQRIANDDDSSVRKFSLGKISGDNVLISNPTDIHISGNGQASFGSITFSKEGEYVFRISCDDFTEYYDLHVNVANDAGILRIIAVYKHMPDEEVNEAGAVFFDQSITISPRVRRTTIGENPASKKYYLLENRNEDNRYISMPSANVMSLDTSEERVFSPIRIYRPGTYIFCIKEVVSMLGEDLPENGPAWMLTIVVSEENGNLQSSCVYHSESDGAENTTAAIFEYAVTKFIPVVKSEFIGNKICNAHFSIKTTTSSQNIPIPDSIFISGEGTMQFSPIYFEKAGTYEFLIEEVSVDSDFEQDKRIYTLTVTVTGDRTGLQADGVYSVQAGINDDPSCATFITLEKATHGWSTTTEAKARKLMSQMTLEEKVGQLFLLHYSDNSVRTAEQIKVITDKYHPAGYIVFQADLKNETPASFRKKIDQTQKDSKIPLIISIDEEGGTVNRASSLKQFRPTAYPSPQTLKAQGGLSAVFSDGTDKAEFLSNLGINLNHAPVADVSTSSGFIYKRTWGGNGLDNAEYVATAVGAMEGAGMGTTLKHFPGYGSTSSDTHNGFAVNYLSKEDFMYNDLLPFYAGMFAGNRAVMVTHNTINCVDSENPASLSPAVYSMLRTELGFEGLAITDDLNMGAITKFVGDGNQSLAALKAGADMALVPNPDKQIPPVLAAARSGELPMSRIEESCFRVLCWKIRNGLLDDISDIHEDELDVSIPVKVVIDDVPVQVGEIKKAYLENSTGTANYRIYLKEAASALEEYGFDLERYVGPLVFGTQASSRGDLSFTQGSINKVDGEWMLSLPKGANLNILSIFFSSLPVQPGAYNLDEAPRNCGFYSIRVNDVIGASSPDQEDVSTVLYAAAGSATEVKLPIRPYPITWLVSRNSSSLFLYDITTQQNNVLVRFRQIYSPIIVTSGTETKVNYTVQYYGNLNVLDKSGTGASTALLDIIDTSGGVVPKNGVNPKIMKLTLNSDGTVKKTNQLKKLYFDETFSFQNTSTLVQVDKLLTFDAHYTPYELWVLKEGKDPASVDRNDWDIYNKNELNLNTLYDLKLSTQEMTNFGDSGVNTGDSGVGSGEGTEDGKSSSSNPSPMDSTVFLTDGATLRLVYEPSNGTSETPADFWDYDITDGYIYSDAAYSNKANTSTQSNSKTAYAKTNRQGIHNPDNYSGSGSKLAFGNANTGSGLATEMIDGMYINQFNRKNGTVMGYKGCFFGLTEGLDGNNNIIYNPKLSTPNLFNDGDAIGKTPVAGHSLQFDRVGDTYTLEAVTGTNTKNLSSFRHPGIYDGIQNKTVIWTNDFWPMDSSKTFGTDGHDMIFGSTAYSQYRKRSSNTPLPVSDDGLDHNSYFGMHFVVDFTLPEGYCGDLEYCFFGDDDIWMFLDGKLVLDIGGCHSSVGEYVNLWDYIPQGDTSPHQLQFFYMERGASGSTCWVQYTIPAAKTSSGGLIDEGSIKVEKTLVGGEGYDRPFEFSVELKNTEGQPLIGNIPALTYDKNDTLIDSQIINEGTGTLTLSDGSYVILSGIPSNSTFTITESEYDCDTYVLIGEVDLSEVSKQKPNREASGTVSGWNQAEVNFVNVFERSELPETGGLGYSDLTIAGISILVFGLGIYWLRKKRNALL